MMFLRTDIGCRATRKRAIAAAGLRLQGLFSVAATLPGCPSAKKDRIRPGS